MGFILESLSPERIYKLFQLVVALLWLLGLFFFHKKALPLQRSIKGVLTLVITLVTGVVAIHWLAEYMSALAGMPQGQSYFGALLAQVIVAYFVITRLWSLNLTQKRLAWNLFSLLSALTYAILRLGCFFRGCCWGEICAYPWATFYKRDDVVTPWLFVPLHPVQLYSMFHGLLILVCLLVLIRRNVFPVERFAPAIHLGVFLFFMGAGRLFTDMFRADIAFHKLSWFGFSPNTVLSILCAVVGLVVVYFSIPNKQTAKL